MKSLATRTKAAPNEPAPRSGGHRTSIVAFAVAGALTTLALQSAWAQEAPPPANYAQSAPDSDPPGRVARLNYMAGTVTTEPAGASDWSYAQVNRPLTTGDQLWNDKNARSELHIGSTAVRMGEQTSLDVLNLDDNSAQLKVAQGTLSTRVRLIAPGSSYEIDTPNLALGVNAPGDYRVDVAPDGSSTTVTVRNGSATVYGDNGQVPVGAGQQVTFTGTSLQQAATNGAPGADPFDQWAASRDAAEDRSVSARYVSREMPGYQDLDANGTWRNTPQYGEVWTPNQAPAGWAPYHDGHWVWQAPWGWTWVDDAPWGFAPYHYGRWAYVDDSWAWVPGQAVVSEPPVYAPALVAFVGDGDGGNDWGVNLAVGGVAAAGLAWFALGPGEPWHPHWGGGHDWSPRYYERVNNTVVVNNRVDIHNNIHNTYINYRAPNAVTGMRATDFVHGQPTNHFGQRVDPAQWHNARFNAGGPGIAPVRQSFAPGMRNATYRPPSNAMARPVVGTRNPGMPAAFHDRLAQNFAQGGHGRVPGAGEPIVHTSVPAQFPGKTLGGNGPNRPNGPVANVRVVNSHGPVINPRAPGQMAGGPNAQRPGGAVPQMDGRQPGMQGHGFAPGQIAGAPGGQPRPGSGGPQNNGQQHGMPMQAGNGVPRPPQFAGGHPMNGAPQQQGQPGGAQRPEAAAGQQHEPMWTQHHAPMAQQRGNPQQSGAGQAPGQVAQQQHAPMQRPANGFGGGTAQGQPAHGPDPRTQQAAAPMQQPQAHPEMRPQPQAQQQPRAEMHPQPQPQAQPRAEFHPQPQPQQQARQEFHPQPQQQPRQEFHPQPQPQQQARQEFHPQPQQQPRQEFHPQPQPQAQPRPPQQAQQPHPQPQSQPQQHQEQRATGGGHDEHHHG
ncbi:DUF6600 domain-containing protein [Paraburkholderia sabiae]|uniref:DUF6600 domain-containing protein n=1 Tax=Paraburkholderia sabiae TaxID=273251 RepID=A0ABU9QQL3_9BURK|nr:DUF6600 domain-containing protein [Paraburkholderia sabiae]WJZ75049.1 FecR domain-containing protein [Paraburkholderia sabiae]CAD6552324.1 hypothetical protein LMG24235_05076 [Paraburkholderia sabiae]